MKFKKPSMKMLFILGVVSLSVVVGLNLGGKEILSDFFTIKAGAGAMEDDDDGEYNFSLLRDSENCSKIYAWGGRPLVRDEVVNKRSLFLCRSKYAVQYDPKIKVPLWSMEILDKKDFVAFNVPASYGPSLDPEVPKKMQSRVEEYQQNKYYLGFLSPIENAYIHSEGSPVELLEEINRVSLRESFYLTNAIPLTPQANIVMKDIDNYFRQISINPNYSQMYVVSGPIYFNGNTKGFVGEGEDKLAIPTHFYKLLLNPLTYGTVAYLVPNDNNLQNKDAYRVTINELERVSGIEFFHKLSPYYAAQVRQDPREFLRKK